MPLSIQVHKDVTEKQLILCQIFWHAQHKEDDAKKGQISLHIIVLQTALPTCNTQLTGIVCSGSKKTFLTFLATLMNLDGRYNYTEAMCLSVETKNDPGK